MKHQYFGDINDYRKYGLLRLLLSECGLRMAICWMLTPDDGRTDGQFTAYLRQLGKWREYDRDLFDTLVEVVPSARHLRHIEERQILGESILIDRVVPDDRAHRVNYFRQVQCDLGDAALVFFDPDNGVEVPSCPPGRKDSSKYAAWSELTATYDSGRSLLVYQHFPRQNRSTFIERIATEFLTRTNASVVTCFQTANVAFFLVPQRAHEDALTRGSEKISSVWRGQIKVSRHNRRSQS